MMENPLRSWQDNEGEIRG